MLDSIMDNTIHHFSNKLNQRFFFSLRFKNKDKNDMEEEKKKMIYFFTKVEEVEELTLPGISTVFIKKNSQFVG